MAYRQGGQTKPKINRKRKMPTPTPIAERIAAHERAIANYQVCAEQAESDLMRNYYLGWVARFTEDLQKMQALLEPACTSCGNGLDSTVDCARCSGAEEGRI